jgi:hypothetical protein
MTIDPALSITKIPSWTSQQVCTIIWQKEGKKGCSHTIALTVVIESVRELPWIAA